MCISNQRECLKYNPPLVCCAVNLVAFIVVLLTAGVYITHNKVIDIDFKWNHTEELKDPQQNITIPNIDSDRALLTEQRIQVLAFGVIGALLVILLYSLFPRKEYKDKLNEPAKRNDLLQSANI